MFDEVFSTGNSLRKAESHVAPFGPDKIKKMALIHLSQESPPLEIETGCPRPGTLSVQDMGYGMRGGLKLRPYNREYAQRAREQIEKKRAELREIASSIKPRKLKGE